MAILILDQRARESTIAQIRDEIVALKRRHESRVGAIACTRITLFAFLTAKRVFGTDALNGEIESLRSALDSLENGEGLWTKGTH
jgi:hypothetical protein